MFSQDVCYVNKNELRLNWNTEANISTNRDSNIIHTMRKHIKNHKDDPGNYKVLGLLRGRNATAD